jgi:hypothetical protein
MKRFVLFSLMTILALSLMSQNCNELYIPLVEGKGFQYQNFNRRDRLEGVNDMVIKSVRTTQGQTEAVMAVKYLDNRERRQHEGEYTVICRGDELIIDIQSLVDRSMMQQSGEGVEVTMSNIQNISLPATLRVGDNLPNASMDFKVTMGAMTMTDMKMLIQNRKVESRESITTPAGTFNCFKISYENVSDMKIMGMNRRIISRTVEYFAPGVGNVRTEHYDDKGRLQSYMVLSKIY